MDCGTILKQALTDSGLGARCRLPARAAEQDADNTLGAGFVELGQMIKFLQTVAEKASSLTYIAGAIAISLMMLQVTAHVISQYFFSFPLPGTILFVGNYYMVAVSFLCLAAVSQRDGHIAVDLVYNLFPKPVRTFFSALSYALTTVIFSLLAGQSFLVAEASRASGTFEMEYGIKIVLWPSYYFIPIGSALMAFVTLVKFISLFDRSTPNRPGDSGQMSGAE